MIYYNPREHKLPMFVLDGGSQSFEEFARLVAEETRGSYPWCQNVKKIRDLEKEKAVKDV